MITPASYDITILQNSTWKGTFRATQNRQTVTSISIDAGTPTFNCDCHGLVANDKVVFTGGTTIPCGLTLNTVYYVINADTSTFQISASEGGFSISVTGTATGTFYVAEPLNLTSYGVDAEIRTLITNEALSPAVEFTSVVTNAAFGVFQLSLTPEATVAIDVGRYGYDISLTTAGGERYYWLTGVATVQRTYSRN